MPTIAQELSFTSNHKQTIAQIKHQFEPKSFQCTKPQILGFTAKVGVSESERKEGGDQGGVWCCHQPQEVTAPGGRWRRSGHDRDGANAK